MTANVFEYITTETRRTPNVNKKKSFSVYSGASVVKILCEQEIYET